MVHTRVLNREKGGGVEDAFQNIRAYHGPNAATVEHLGTNRNHTCPEFIHRM